MNKGVITIAVGSTTYGRMALNLAVSIKRNSATPIALIYTPSAVKDILPLLTYFDHLIEIPDTDKPVRTCMNLKVRLNDKTPFDKTIFLDADCIITPTHKVDELFDRVDGVQFTAYNTHQYKLSEKPYDKYNHWAEPNDVMKKFGLSADTEIPQINSSFLYWEKGAKSDRIFSEAKRVIRSGIKHDEFRGEFPDELAFNVACAITKTYPHKKRFKPIYLNILNETISKEYIIENYACMSVIGTKTDSRIIQYYNDFVSYYSDLEGIVMKSYFNNKVTEKESRKIIGFYHICMINNYMEVVLEQVQDLLMSGLYDASQEIKVVLAGDAADAEIVKKFLSDYYKINVVELSSVKAYEFPTIRQVKLQSNRDEKAFYYYIHTKGVTYPNHKGGKYWRDYMMWYNVHKWQDCVQKLMEGYETCGCKLVENHRAFPMHYSGNFWWARSEYIKRCPPVEGLNHQDRYQAEFWSCKGSPNAATLCQIYIDYDKNPPYK